MLYLDYAKPLANGKYILSFFADSAEDLESISHGQKFVTKNGTDYGVPQAGSTVIITSPTSGKTTYVMDAEGIWVVTEDISYSAVVANPSDEATAKLEKLKVNDTTYANWTESEIKALAGGGGGELYLYRASFTIGTMDFEFNIYMPYTADKFAFTRLIMAGNGYVDFPNDTGDYVYIPVSKFDFTIANGVVTTGKITYYYNGALVEKAVADKKLHFNLVGGGKF